MTKYNLPVEYSKLQWNQRIEVREQYIQEQNGNCMYCGCSLKEPAPKHIQRFTIDWDLFPSNFMKYPHTKLD